MSYGPWPEIKFYYLLLLYNIYVVHNFNNSECTETKSPVVVQTLLSIM